jgi:hypothetical protein
MLIGFGIALIISANAQGAPGRKSTAAPTQQSVEAQPTIPIAIQNDIHDIARSLDREANRKPSALEDERAEKNLQSQEDMAKWAGRMFFVGLSETLVTLIGVVLVALTLWQTKRAADAAKQTLGLTDKNSKLELRAYLSVEPAGIRQLLGRNEGLGQVSVRNVGKVPARDVYVFVCMRLSADRDVDFAVPADPDDVSRVIQPGAAMTQGSQNYLPISDVIKPGKNIFVFGVVYYGDGLNSPRRYTRFCHRYSTSSYDDSLPWQRASNITKTIIEREKARYHTHGNEAD